MESYWFCTNNQKDVYKDMQANPEVEVSVLIPLMRGFVSMEGRF